MTSTPRPLRVGLISANWGAKSHLPAWRAVPGVEVVAICTSREETARTAADQHGIPRAIWDFNALAADPDIDLIDIGTRPLLRYEMLKAALSCGKHVYAGVPFTATLDQAEEIVALAQRNGLVGASDAYFQHIPAHAELGYRLRSGEIGQVLSVSAELQINLFNPTRPDYPYFWFGEAANGASALRNLGSHVITLLVSLLGQVEAVVGVEDRKLAEWRAQDGAIHKPEVSDTASLLIQFGGGVIATLNLSWIDAGPIGWRLDVHGSTGRLTARHPIGFPNHSHIELFAASPEAPTETKAPLSAVFTHSRRVDISHDHQPRPCYPMALSFDCLKSAIEGRGEPAPSLKTALHVERVLAAAARSVRSRAWEPIPG